MKCVILQPSYIPWRGYFHQIALADVFIYLDDVQYDKRGWRNRNQIKTADGLQWLTIPVHSRGVQKEHIPINQIPIAWDTEWNQEHLKMIFHAYKRAPYFSSFFPFLEKLLSQKFHLLADFTIETSTQIARYLGIKNTRFVLSSSLSVGGRKTERLINLLQRVGANHYISGPSAKDYVDDAQFAANQITLEYMKYNYPDYPQLYPPFISNVSIVDLIFMTGPKAIEFFNYPLGHGAK